MWLGRAPSLLIPFPASSPGSLRHEPLRPPDSLPKCAHQRASGGSASDRGRPPSAAWVPAPLRSLAPPVTCPLSPASIPAHEVILLSLSGMLRPTLDPQTRRRRRWPPLPPLALFRLAAHLERRGSPGRPRPLPRSPESSVRPQQTRPCLRHAGVQVATPAGHVPPFWNLAFRSLRCGARPSSTPSPCGSQDTCRPGLCPAPPLTPSPSQSRDPGDPGPVLGLAVPSSAPIPQGTSLGSGFRHSHPAQGSPRTPAPSAWPARPVSLAEPSVPTPPAPGAAAHTTRSPPRQGLPAHH